MRFSVALLFPFTAYADGCRFLRCWRGMTVAVLFGLLTGCTGLPSLEQRSSSHALELEQARSTAIGKTVTTLAAAHPELSGIYPLANPQEAFAVRTMLADAAERTLDVQYYIWRNDLTGSLLLNSLRRAADRGVRVRFLLDDSSNVGFDETLAALDAHENIEVRLVNPLAIRFPRWINFIVDFSRVNRRMHNKSFTADNQATIIGGRNVGDEYFGATNNILFSDLDVLAVGPVVQDVSTDFDLYWNSESAYPVSLLLPEADSEQTLALEHRINAMTTGRQAEDFIDAMQKSDLISELLKGTIALEWAPTQMLSDPPGKILGKTDDNSGVAWDLKRFFGEPETSMDLVSSYFVPAKAGTQHLTALAERGVSIRILTNSLAATDVAAVHAGYAKRRKTLLRAGIKLYETHPAPQEQDAGASAAAPRPPAADRPAFRSWRWGFGSKSTGSGPFGSSGSSLHAKTLSIDGKKVFVGSFNFDPRSARLNTELGFVIDSPDLARGISSAFMDRIPRTSYEVHLSDDNTLYWTWLHNDRVERYDAEPQASVWRRAWVGFLSILPIEWML